MTAYSMKVISTTSSSDYYVQSQQSRGSIGQRHNDTSKFVGAKRKKISTVDEQRNVRATYALAFCFVRVVAVVALIAHAKAKR